MPAGLLANDQARVHPLRLAAALARRAGSIATGVAMTDLEVDGGRIVRVRTTGGELHPGVVAPVPVNELHPDQVGMRLAPRSPHAWSASELTGQFLDRCVYFLTWDGQRVEAEVAGFGALSDELYLAWAAHAPGPGPTISLWIPALQAYCWANPESLTVCDPLSEARLPSRL
jgi:hypothetical protein